jgi:hypothetical protein
MSSNRSARRSFCITLAMGLLALGKPTAAQDTESVVQLVDPQPQQAEQFCWAAVSMTALNTVNRRDGRSSSWILPTQWHLAAYRAAQSKQTGVFSCADYSRLSSTKVRKKANTKALKHWSKTCVEEKSVLCNEGGLPILLDQDYDDTATRRDRRACTPPDPGPPPSYCDLKRQFDDGRPVVFGWNDIPEETNRRGEPLHASGNHYLVANGVRIENGVPQVLIYDPWPKQDPDPSINELEKHAKWIDYEMFAHPKFDHGVEAQYEFARLDIRRPGVARVAEAAGDCTVSIPASLPIRLVDDRIEQVSRQFQPSSIANTLRSELPTLTPEQRFGIPFALVVLNESSIVRVRGDATALFDDMASVVMVPIQNYAGKVVDAFSAAHDVSSWRRAGYINNGVASLMVMARAVHDERGSPEPAAIMDYFMVSIPERRSFFVAFTLPSGTKWLVPIADDERVKAKRWQAEKASDLLPRIAARIEEERRYDTGQP